MEKIPSYINTLYIFLSHYCPLNCSYCYIKDRSDTKTISLETVGRTLDLFDEPPHIVFFGGEPLAQIPLIEEIMAAYPKCKYQVVTSGYNLEEFLSKQLDCRVQVSWDGVPKIATAQGLEKLSKIKGMQVRCVLHDGNINHMYDIYKIFQEWRLKGFSLCGDFTIAHIDKRREDFAVILKEQLDKILNDHQEIHVYLPQTIETWIRNVYAGGQHASCDAGRYIALLPNGDLYPCVIMSQHGVCKLGNIYTEISPEILDDLFVRPKECQGCTSPLCSGGCIIERNNSIAKHNCDNMKVIEEVIHKYQINTVNESIKWTNYYLGG